MEIFQEIVVGNKKTYTFLYPTVIQQQESGIYPPIMRREMSSMSSILNMLNS